MPSAGLEPAIPASERSQTHALDRTAGGISDLHPLVALIPRKGPTELLNVLHSLYENGGEEKNVGPLLKIGLVFLASV
jgi:hypothetical protein